MDSKHKRSMIIHFNDGSKMTLGFATPAPDSDANLATRLKDALDARHLVLETEAALLVIPVGSIKYLQCYPRPDKLPAYAIKSVSLKE